MRRKKKRLNIDTATTARTARARQTLSSITRRQNSDASLLADLNREPWLKYKIRRSIDFMESVTLTQGFCWKPCINHWILLLRCLDGVIEAPSLHSPPMNKTVRQKSEICEEGRLWKQHTDSRRGERAEWD